MNGFLSARSTGVADIDKANLIKPLAGEDGSDLSLSLHRIFGDVGKRLFDSCLTSLQVAFRLDLFSAKMFFLTAPPQRRGRPISQ